MCNELKILEKFCKETLKKIEGQKSIEAALGSIDIAYVKVKELAVINSIANNLDSLEFINQQN